MYVPKDKPIVHEERWSDACLFEGASYVAPWELREHYQLVQPYDHVCRKCGSKMQVIKEDDLIPEGKESEEKGVKVNVNCPKCHKPMVVGGYIMWD